MKKRILSILLTAAMLVAVPANQSVWAEEATAEETTAEEAATEESTAEVTEASEAEEAAQEEAVITTDTEDYRLLNEEGKTYPVVIYCHQNMGSHKSFKNPGWLEDLAKEGYIGYCFDFCGGTTGVCLSDMEYEDSTDETQVSDINAIIEFVKEQPFCDQENLYLLGGSRGGRDVALAAPQHNEDIAGIVLLYPALTDETLLENSSGYTGDALLIHGINDVTVSYTVSVDALGSIYSESNSELLLLSGKDAVHSFDGVHPELKAVAEDSVIDFLNRHVEASKVNE